MAEDRERIRRMAEFRTQLERRMQRVEAELGFLRALLELVDTALLEKRLEKAEIVKPAPAPKPSEPTPLPSTLPEAAPPTTLAPEGATPLKTVTGVLLANLYVGENSLRLVLAQDKEFNINTPPFTVFLVDRVLTKMREKDREAARTGEIAPDKVLSYNIARDGDIIREVIIQNVTPERSRELKSAIRWTLERMWETISMKAS